MVDVNIMYAEIIINSDALEIDRLFTYKVPYELIEKINVGFRVKVPFGQRSKPVEGFVYSILQDDCINFKYRVKDILTLVHLKLYLNNAPAPHLTPYYYHFHIYEYYI